MTATPRKQPVKKQPQAVTSVSEWKTAAQGQLLELPSGKVIRVKMPGMQAFLTANLIPNSLMPIVLAAISEGKPADNSDMQELVKDPQILVELSNSIDKIFLFCVVEPEVSAVPDEGVERDPDTLYVDEIDLDDKSFVFQCAVGGTRDLEQFRAEQAAALADVQPVS